MKEYDCVELEKAENGWIITRTSKDYTKRQQVVTEDFNKAIEIVRATFTAKLDREIL